MNNLKTAVSFILGLGIGGVGGWFLLKETYRKYAENDISSVKEAFHVKEEQMMKKIEELTNKSEGDKDSNDISEESDDGEPEKKNPYKNMVKDVTKVKGKYHNIDHDISSMKNVAEDLPYVVSPNDFGEKEDYLKVSLTYYIDGVLADDTGYVIDNVEEMIGDALEHFGEYEDDSVFCRNDAKKCDYEILKDLHKYSDIRKNMPRNI